MKNVLLFSSSALLKKNTRMFFFFPCPGSVISLIFLPILGYTKIVRPFQLKRQYSNGPPFNFFCSPFLSEMVLWGQNICPWRSHLIRKPNEFILNQKWRTRDGLLLVGARINNATTLRRVENNLSDFLNPLLSAYLFSYNAFECSPRYNS